jgi:imidazolonepropionase-like amidohydrolase
LNRFFRVAGALLLLAPFGCGKDPGPTVAAVPGLVIDDVTVIDGVHGVRARQSIVVRGDTIVTVGPKSEVAVPTGARMIDGRGRYLIPGLWDADVHITHLPGIGVDTWYPLLFANGVLSVRDMGGPLNDVLAARDAARVEGAAAPRVFVAGLLVDGPRPLFPAEAVAVDSLAEVRVVIDSIKTEGVDFVELYEMLPAEVFAAGVAYAQ